MTSAVTKVILHAEDEPSHNSHGSAGIAAIKPVGDGNLSPDLVAQFIDDGFIY